MDSISMAHVADALEALDRTFGYDAAADRAAYILGRDTGIRRDVQAFMAGTMSDRAFRARVGIAHRAYRR